MRNLSASKSALYLETRSPLIGVDPRVKLLMSFSASLAIMLTLERLAIFMIGYCLLLLWARLLPQAARQVWRIRWLLIFLFVLDVLLINLELAVIVTLRLMLLSGVFVLLFATTTHNELSLAIESLHLPYRYAFSLGLAFQSITLLEDEWRTIQEAQQARGILPSFSFENWRQTIKQLPSQTGDLVALTVPAIVMTTKRAWSITESAYARGFDSPKRRPYRRLKMSGKDWVYLALTLAVVLLIFWR